MYGCIFYLSEVIFIVCVDYGIFASPSDTEIDQKITDIGSKFDIEYQRNLNDYIGINIYFPPDGNIKPLQPHLIEQIAQDLNLLQRAPPRPTPARYRMITQQYISAPLFDHQFHHCYVIGKLNFLDKFPEATSPMQLIK